MEKNVIQLEILEDLEGSGVEAISLVNEPATESYWLYFKSEKPEVKEVKLSINDDKQIVVGCVMIPELEIYRAPLEEGEKEFYIRFSAETVEKMARKFMKDLRLKETNVQHKDSIDAGSYVTESWIVENLEDKANTVYNLSVPVGSWCIKMKVEDPKIWALVKSEDLKGFSLQGNFVPKEDIDEEVAKQTLETIKKLLGK